MLRRLLCCSCSPPCCACCSPRSCRTTALLMGGAALPACTASSSAPSLPRCPWLAAGVHLGRWDAGHNSVCLLCRLHRHPATGRWVGGGRAGREQGTVPQREGSQGPGVCRPVGIHTHKWGCSIVTSCAPIPPQSIPIPLLALAATIPPHTHRPAPPPCLRHPHRAPPPLRLPGRQVRRQAGAGGWRDRLSACTLFTPQAAAAGVPALVAMRVAMGLGEGVAFPAIHSLIGGPQWVPRQGCWRAGRGAEPILGVCGESWDRRCACRLACLHACMLSAAAAAAMQRRCACSALLPHCLPCSLPACLGLPPAPAHPMPAYSSAQRGASLSHTSRPL